MIPITPKGTLTFVNLIPLGRTLSFNTLPKGEGSVATLRVSAANVLLNVLPSILTGRTSDHFCPSVRGLFHSLQE